MPPGPIAWLRAAPRGPFPHAASDFARRAPRLGLGRSRDREYGSDAPASSPWPAHHTHNHAYAWFAAGRLLARASFARTAVFSTAIAGPGSAPSTSPEAPGAAAYRHWHLPVTRAAPR